MKLKPYQDELHINRMSIIDLFALYVIDFTYWNMFNDFVNITVYTDKQQALDGIKGFRILF